MTENFLLFSASLNLNDIIDVCNYKINEWKMNLDKVEYNRDFFLEIEEELDSYKIETRFQSLIKLFLSFTDFKLILNKYIIFSKQFEDIFNKNVINDSFKNGIIDSLVENLKYLYLKFMNYNKIDINLSKLELIFFIKINIYLLFLQIYFLRKNKEMEEYIKYQGEELEIILLKFFKIGITNKYVPSRICLCVYYLYFILLTKTEKEEKNEISTCREVSSKKKQDNLLTKQNYQEFFKPKIPLIVNYTLNSKNPNYFIEKYYRDNMLKRGDTTLERVIIFRILKILLATFETTKNPQGSTSEFIKDYIVEIILRNYYLEKKNPPFKEEFNEGDNILNKEIFISDFSNYINSFKDDIKLFYNLIEIFNRISITLIVDSFYCKFLKILQKNNLIQYSFVCFHLKDSRGLYVLFRILKEEYKENENTIINEFNNDEIKKMYKEISEFTVSINIKLIYKISVNYNEYIYKLIDCKVPVMLKKILIAYDSNEKIKKNALKLFKCQIKYFDKNWRSDNSNIISEIFLHLSFDFQPNENYLEFKEPSKIRESNVYFNEDEAKKLHEDFHEYNYFSFMNKQENFEKFVIEKNSSLYAKIYSNIKKKVDEDNHFK